MSGGEPSSIKREFPCAARVPVLRLCAEDFLLRKVVLTVYQALYRKWRPKTFSEVVGQEHITSTLQRQVAEGKTAHAYLFTGTRGTGKTTCARILAKAVNCLDPVDGAPCCQCEACLGIDNGSLLDVTELDAASNNGVDQVRALREEAVYTPSVLRKRVYIIDEVHMLSTAAFNALLKILEEPPEHLLFILATTELHKVPATILSRCQRFSFKRILPRDMEQQLLKIAQAENIDLTPDGAEILSRMANGALRDTLSLLDQCRVAEGAIDTKAVLNVLGLAGSVQTLQLMRFILDGNSADALALFGKLYRDGKDVAALLGELGDLARDLTIIKAAPDGGAALLGGLYDRKTLTDLAGDLPLKRFLYLAQTVQSTCAELDRSLRPRTDGELCILRLCDETLSGDLTALESRIAKLESAVKNGVSAVKATRPASKRYDDAPPIPEEPPFPDEPPLPEAPPVFEDSPKPAPKKTAPAASGDSGIWAKLLEQYKGHLAVNQRVFLNMASGALDGDCLRVFCSNDFVKSSLDDPTILGVLKEVTEQDVGHPVRVELAIGNAPKADKPKASAVSASPAPQPVSPSATQADDPFASLMSKGKTLQNFTIKGEQ